jgi:hypothetical protein
MTRLAIRGEAFLIDGPPTYAGRTWRGHRIEGLLLNARMVQATFDDLNPATRGRWAYPDTGVWDSERNVREFLAMLPEYRRYGLLGITVNLQGGSPEGYSKEQPWDNSAFDPDGALRLAFMDRLRRVLDRADDLGMVVIVGYFYCGQDERLRDEMAVRRAVENATHWLLAGGWENVLVEINNECDVPRYEHAILQPRRVHELIALARGITHEGRRLLVGTSYLGIDFAKLVLTPAPTARDLILADDLNISAAVIAVSDFLLIHGNGALDPSQIALMVARVRALPGYRPLPIVCNEDDHFAFEQPINNFAVALANRVSWGYFDPGEGVGGAGALGLPGWLPARARELGYQHGPEARLLRVGRRDRRSHVGRPAKNAAA